MTVLISGLEAFFLLYFIGINLFYLVLFVLSCFGIFMYHNRVRKLSFYEVRNSPITPPISILVPAYNEGKTISACVLSLLVLSYPKYEVIVINDGSTDPTMDELKKIYKLKKTARVYHRDLPTGNVRGIYKSLDFPNLVVVDKENGGKSDALNCGINVSQFPLFCCIDADSLLERDSLLRVVQPFLNEYFKTVAVGGIVRVANGCTISHGLVTGIGLSKGWLPNFQVIEYLRAFLSGRMGFSVMDSLLIISGAFSLFKKESVVQAKGFRSHTVGEDMELVVSMHQTFREKLNILGYRIAFIPDPVCWTEVPTKFSDLGRQRNRWHRGLGETLVRHRNMLFNPRYGKIGLLSMPYFFLVEFLSPVFETLGYIFFGLLVMIKPSAWKISAVFFILAVLYGVFLSVSSVLLEEFTLHRYPKVKNFLKLWGTALLENFGYHQLTVFWRLGGIRDLLRRDKTWGALQRTGFKEPV